MKKFPKAIAAMMLMTVAVCMVGCKLIDFSKRKTHEFVDLGLPSGTLWATCNVGANKPEDYGKCFAWGEIKPKSTCNWNTYKYCKGDDASLTKYCTISSFGYEEFADSLIVLQPTDDAATANWEDGWYMPTEEQWEELYKNTTNTWTTQNGVNGRLFTAGNGNSLFLPAAGNRWGSEVGYAGSYGSYWSSTLGFDLPSGAWNFFFDLEDCHLSGCRRDIGQSVRAVRSVPLE